MLTGFVYVSPIFYSNNTNMVNKGAPLQYIAGTPCKCYIKLVYYSWWLQAFNMLIALHCIM